MEWGIVGLVGASGIPLEGIACEVGGTRLEEWRRTGGRRITRATPPQDAVPTKAGDRATQCSSRFVVRYMRKVMT